MIIMLDKEMSALSLTAKITFKDCRLHEEKCAEHGPWEETLPRRCPTKECTARCVHEPPDHGELPARRRLGATH